MKFTDRAGNEILVGSLFACAREKMDNPRLFFGKVISVTDLVKVVVVDDMQESDVRVQKPGILKFPDRILVLTRDLILKPTLRLLDKVEVE